ncbi:MAG: ComEC/Rec2 family competence protein [Kiritimatiellia bacterium]
MTTRRTFIRTGAAAAALAALGRAHGGAAATCPGWRPGELDIHFIHTGVGEQTFFVFPDGTTMLLDCGDTHHAKYMRDVPPLPSAERCGGEWVSRYLRRLVPQREIDYLMVSHWHGDHIGDPSLGCWRNAQGEQICGISAVAEDFRFRRYFDHQFPHPGRYALDPDPEAYARFQAWLAKARAAGLDAQPFRVGALDQIRLQHDAARYPQFHVRNLCANAVVDDGKGGTVDCGAGHVQSGRRTIHENRLSAAIRIDYGNFSYYTGGDNELELCRADGTPFNWERRVGEACGPVDVAKTNHHAGTHAMSPEFCAAVRPRVWLSSVWQAAMVDHHSLKSMCSRTLYSGERYVCFGYIADRVKAVAAAYGDDIAPAGHAVVKVAPGGDAYEVFTLDAHDESMRVLARRAFVSRGNASGRG